jgi:hypothetical protein
MILPHLDGLLQSEQSALLEEHTLCCTYCARELALQEKISRTIREIGQEEFKAPPEMGGLVMSRLKPERRGYINRFPLSWRQTVAAVAALLTIAGGSAGVTAGLKMAGGGKMIALDPPAAVTDDSGGAPDTDPAVLPGSIDGSAKNQDNNTGISNMSQLDPSDISTGAAGSKTGIEEKQPASATALLNSNMIITSTLLKIEVNDLSEARIKAVALAAGAEAVTQVFPEQNGDRKIVVLRLTLAADHAPGLIAQFSGLGTLADRQDESRDITAMYNETMVLCNDLESRRSAAANTVELQQLEQQITSYRQQLDTWAAEAGKRVIMLWLEN